MRKSHFAFFLFVCLSPINLFLSKPGPLERNRFCASGFNKISPMPTVHWATTSMECKSGRGKCTVLLGQIVGHLHERRILRDFRAQEIPWKLFLRAPLSSCESIIAADFCTALHRFLDTSSFRVTQQGAVVFFASVDRRVVSNFGVCLFALYKFVWVAAGELVDVKSGCKLWWKAFVR